MHIALRTVLCIIGICSALVAIDSCGKATNSVYYIGRDDQSRSQQSQMTVETSIVLLCSLAVLNASIVVAYALADSRSVK